MESESGARHQQAWAPAHGWQFKPAQAGYQQAVESDVRIQEVKTFETSGGNVRFVSPTRTGTSTRSSASRSATALRPRAAAPASPTTRTSAASTRTCTSTRSSRFPMTSAATATPTRTRPPGARLWRQPRGSSASRSRKRPSAGRALRQAASVQGQGRGRHQRRVRLAARRLPLRRAGAKTGAERCDGTGAACPSPPCSSPLLSRYASLNGGGRRSRGAVSRSRRGAAAGCRAKQQCPNRRAGTAASHGKQKCARSVTWTRSRWCSSRETTAAARFLAWRTDAQLPHT